MKFTKILTAVGLAVAFGAAAAAPPKIAPTGRVGKPGSGIHAKHKYTAKQAQAIALKKYHGKIFGKVKLEKEDGKWEYAVVIRTRKGLLEVMVGADSGKIASVEKTTAKEERTEAGVGRAGVKPTAKPKAK